MFQERGQAAFTFDETDADQLCQDVLALTSLEDPPAREEQDVFTQYFDTDDLALYRIVADGAPPNDQVLQVRLRAYGVRHDGPVYLETKWLTGMVAHKRRLTLTATQADLLRSGGGVTEDAVQRDSVDPMFGRILEQIAGGRLSQKLSVKYYRRAYQATYARVTVDTNIVYMRWPEQTFTVRPDYGVLEIKAPTPAELNHLIKCLTKKSTVRLGRPVSKFIEATHLLYTEATSRADPC